MLGAESPPVVAPLARSRMPALVLGLCLAFMAAAVAVIVYHGRSAPPRPTEEVYFTPGDPTTTALVTELNAAKQTIRVQAYSFTSAPIAKALVDARKRGIEVTAILDKSQRTAQYSSADFLVHEGVPTFIDAQHAIAHNKIMIIDGVTVVTGSFNFTKAAQDSNAENLLLLRGNKLAEEYEQNFQTHLAHSFPYEGR